MKHAHTKQSGFTLMELLISIVIVGILVGIALPSFSYVVANNQMSSSVNTVVGAFNLARAEAAQRGVRVAIGSQSATTDWVGGYRIWVDTNSDNTFDAGETEVRRFDGLASGLTFTSSLAATSFNGLGFLTSNAGISLNICSSESAVNDRQINVTLSGRTESSNINCP